MDILKGKSCPTDLIAVCDEAIKLMVEERDVDVNHLALARLSVLSS